MSEEEINEEELTDAEKLLAALNATAPEDFEEIKFGDLAVPKSERRTPRGDYGKFTRRWHWSASEKKKRRNMRKESRRKNRQRRKR